MPIPRPSAPTVQSRSGSGSSSRSRANREPRLPQSIGQQMDEPILDCLVIGGGPAGLTAAIYLARFHLDIMVVDGGKSRASWIPCTHNHAGFPDGIKGTELLARMRDQACKYGAKI